MHQETFIGGVWYPGPTTVLSGSKSMPYLDKWLAENPVWAPKKTRAANNIGTDFHSGVEARIHGRPYTPKYARVAKMLKRWDEWAASVNAVIDHTELRVVSHKHVYAGTLDAVGTLDGEPCIFDWKTSSGIKDDMSL